MAKSLLTTLVKTGKAIERDRKRRERESARDHAAAVRRAEQARKAEEKAIQMQEKAELAQRSALEKKAQKRLKEFEKEAKLAHIEKMKATVEERNYSLVSEYEDIDSLLSHTLDVDDYVDLEKLRRTTDNPPFEPGELGIVNKAPVLKAIPEKPVFQEPPKPKGIFGRKKKLILATEEAQAAFDKAYAQWEAEKQKIETDNENLTTTHRKFEQVRLERLAQAKKSFESDVIEHNEALNSLISNLGYGTTDAIEDYVSIVVANSAYPEHFQVDHTFTFDPQVAELRMQVTIPAPEKVQSIKAYKYKQSTDEITTTNLSLKAQKDRYNNAVNQVAIRSFHEIFEADRRGLIKTISLEVGTETHDPATGKLCFISFIAAAAERDTFLEFDLSTIVLAATLTHIGASISKNPFALTPVNSEGVKRI